MLHGLRETRARSLISLCALSLFLFSASLWSVLTYELDFQDPLLDRATSALAGLATQVVLLGLSLVALFVVALAPLTHALTHHQAGTLLFAILWLGLGIVGGIGDRPWFGLDGHLPLLFLVLAWLPGGIIALCVGVGLLVTGVNGLQARRKGRWWPGAFALAIDLLLPVGLTRYTLSRYALWGRDISTSRQFPPGGFFVGNVFFVSLANFLSSLLLDMAPYLLLGALLLALAGNESSTRSGRVTRRFGVAFTLVLVVTLAAVARLRCPPLAAWRCADLRSHPRCLAALWWAVDRPAADRCGGPGCCAQPRASCADPQLSGPAWSRTECAAAGFGGPKSTSSEESRRAAGRRGSLPDTLWLTGDPRSLTGNNR